MSRSLWFYSYTYGFVLSECFVSLYQREKEKERAEGRAEGKAEGVIETKRATAINMKRLGLDIQIIIECTGLSKDQIETYLGKEKYHYEYRGKLPEQFVEAYNYIIDLLGLDIEFKGTLTKECPKTYITHCCKVLLQFEMFGYRRCHVRDYIKKHFKDYIILSCVRSNEHKTIGFLQDPRK